jgi:hypothetical protein
MRQIDGLDSSMSMVVLGLVSFATTCATPPPPRATPVAECPKTYAAIHAGAVCGNVYSSGFDRSCTYEEGECRCMVPPTRPCCPEEAPNDGTMTWRCATAAEIRGDCPSGFYEKACDPKERQSCRAGFNRSVYECIDGSWQLTNRRRP